MTQSAEQEQTSFQERIEDWFQMAARKTSIATGKPMAFVIAALILVVWGITGPAFRFSDTWQLVINTGTSLVTFLMVFLIQESQNHDTRAIQVKLAELIIAVQGAQNTTAAAEDLSDKDLEALHQQLLTRAKEAQTKLHLRQGQPK